MTERDVPNLTVDTGEPGRCERLMAGANRAYEAADEATLRRVLEDDRSSPGAVAGKGPGTELARLSHHDFV